jgi:hypothetical protein
MRAQIPAVALSSPVRKLAFLAVLVTCLLTLSPPASRASEEGERCRAACGQEKNDCIHGCNGNEACINGCLLGYQICLQTCPA